MATYVTPKINTIYIFYISLVSQANTKIFQANPTIAAGDFLVATGDGAPGNLGTLPVVDADFTKRLKVTLSAAEMNDGNVTFIASDAAGAEWCDLTINIQTSARQIDDLAFPATTGRSMVVDAAGLVDANMVKAGATGAGNTITTSGAVTLPAATLASTTNITAGTITTTTNLTNLPTIPANWLTAAGTAADFGAELATAIWTDTTAADFTVALSIGKSVMNGVALGTGLTINAYTGNTIQTGDSFARIGAAGISLTAVALADATSDAVLADAIWNAATATYGAAGSYGLLVETDLDAAISSRLATAGYTAPSNLTAAQIATGVWTDTTAGDFTTALSIGKSVMNGVALGTGLTINSYTGNTVQTGDTFALANGASGFVATKVDTAAILVDTAEIGAAGAGLTNIGTIATVTNLTNLPAAAALEATLTAMKGATFAGATDSLEAIRDRGDAAWVTATGFATPTNITAGTITTTTNLTNNNDKTGYALSAAGSAALTEGYPADGATGTLAQILYEIKAFLGEKNISGTTVTTKKLDGATTAATYTLDSATAPTTITRAT